MKYVLLPALLLSCFSSKTHMGLLEEANTLYKADQKDEAKKLYESAAKKGSVEAHYLLTYQYILSPEEDLYHLEYAARSGHAPALEAVLDRLMLIDPKRGLDLYNETKVHHPDVSFYNEGNTVQVLKYLSELPPRNLSDFLKEFDLDSQQLNRELYGYWELAEEASKEGSRFGTPDSELTLWLIAQGGGSPAAYNAAVEEFYNHWKNGEVVSFNLCDFITSGLGMGYCANRFSIKAEEERVLRISALGEGLSKENQAALQNAYRVMEEYVEQKVRLEEMHGGSGVAAWMLESSNKQRDEYLTFIQGAIGGTIPEEVDLASELDGVFINTLDKIEQEKLDHWPQAEDVRGVHSYWQKHQVATCQFVAQVVPNLEEQCLSYLASQRLETLRQITEMY